MRYIRNAYYALCHVHSVIYNVQCKAYIFSVICMVHEKLGKFNVQTAKLPTVMMHVSSLLTAAA